MNNEKPTGIAADLRGLSKLTIDASIGLTDLIEALHHNISGMSGMVPTKHDGQTSGLTGAVYRAVRGATRITGAGINATLELLAPLLPGLTDRYEREHIQSALNGVLGDHLEASANPLAITMALRIDGKPLTMNREALIDALPAASGRILLMIHGLCMNDRQWTCTRADGSTHDHGKAVQEQCSLTAVYLHYNSGRHIADNGQSLSNLLQDLILEWPVAVDEIVIVAHSMGGLVARGALHYASGTNQAWPGLVSKLIFLGTPHLGAPLERGGHWFDLILGATPFAAPFSKIGKMRSKGITDLRHGSITGKHTEFLPMPDGIGIFAFAGSISADTGEIATRILGDGLVPIASALGEHANPARSLNIPKCNKFIAPEINHMQLLHDEKIFLAIRTIIDSGQPE